MFERISRNKKLNEFSGEVSFQTNSQLMPSETFEISGTSPTHSVVSENGKKYYYLNVQQPASVPNQDAQELQSHSQIISDVAPTQSSSFEEHIKSFAQESSGPLHYYGENMVVRNAREMFNNVDILADGRYFCCVCRRPYKTHATLTAHLRGSHLRQESPCAEKDCNHVSVTENERRKHQKWHDKMKYSRIIRNPTIKTETIAEPRSPSENALREQFARSTMDVAGMKTEEDKRGKLKYICTHCGQSFNNPFQATRHSELHGNTPKQCFYCGEILKGTMDLHVHYMRFHKNEGVRTITCKVCNRAFTSTTLFRNHANQMECELACKNSMIRQDMYYGDLPHGTMIDHITQNRLNFFRKTQKEREQMESVTGPMGGARGETVRHHQQMHYEPAPTAAVTTTSDAAAGSSSCAEGNKYSDIFDESSNSLIQTEFGLKNFAEFKTSRAAKRGIDHDQIDVRKIKRELVTENNNYSHYCLDNGAHDHHQHPATTQSQQQNYNWSTDYIYPPPTYGYDPLIGTYPDYQPMQQFATFPPVPAYYPPYPYYDQPLQEIPMVKQEMMTPEKVVNNDVSHHRQYPLGSASEIASDLLVNQQGDIVFEELDKLDFVMPEIYNNNTVDNNDVADLEGMFNF